MAASYDWRPVGTPNLQGKLTNPFTQLLTRQQQEDELAQEKDFRDKQLAQGDRRQDYVEGATARQIAEEQRKLGLEQEKTGLVEDMSRGLIFGGAERLGDPEVQLKLKSDPRYQALEAETATTGNIAPLLEYQNKFIENNAALLTRPSEFAGQLRQNLQATGKFTGPEIEAAVAAQVARRYPTADPEMVKAMMVKPSLGGTSDSAATGVTGGTGGPSKLFSSQVGQANVYDLINNFASQFGVGDEEVTTWFGMSPEEWGSDPDVSKSRIVQYVDRMRMEGFSPEAALGALSQVMQEDQESSFRIDDMNSADLLHMKNLATAAQKQQREGYGGRGGSASAKASMQDRLGTASEYNTRLLSSLSPQALENDELVARFLKGIGPAPTAQTPSTGTPPPVSTGTPAPVEDTRTEVQKLLNLGNVSAPVEKAKLFGTPEQAEYPVGVPSEDEALLTKLSEAATFSPVGWAANKAEGLGGDLINSLTPPGPGVLEAQPEPRETHQERAALLEEYQGTGAQSRAFESKLSGAQYRAYRRAQNPKTPRAEAIRIMEMLKAGKTPTQKILSQ